MKQYKTSPEMGVQPGLEQSAKGPGEYKTVSNPEVALGNCKPARTEPRAEPGLLGLNKDY